MVLTDGVGEGYRTKQLQSQKAKGILKDEKHERGGTIKDVQWRWGKGKGMTKVGDTVRTDKTGEGWDELVVVLGGGYHHDVPHRMIEGHISFQVSSLECSMHWALLLSICSTH